MFAVIETGGKQYMVTDLNRGDPGYDESRMDKMKRISIEKLDVKEGETIVFDRVMAIIDGDNFKAGTPVVAGAKVTAKVIKNGKGKKIYVMKYKAKKNEKKKIGHRQPYTMVEIQSIEG